MLRWEGGARATMRSMKRIKEIKIDNINYNWLEEIEYASGLLNYKRFEWIHFIYQSLFINILCVKIWS